MKLFVYGTLKKGFGNHRYLEKSTLLDNCCWTHGVLVDLGHFPGMLEDPTKDSKVYGELYEIDEDTLARCDLLEGYRSDRNPDFNLYNRAVVDVNRVDGTVDKGVYTYFYARNKKNKAGAPILKSGVWKY